jgi:hypothetical protein
LERGRGWLVFAFDIQHYLDFTIVAIKHIQIQLIYYQVIMSALLQVRSATADTSRSVLHLVHTAVDAEIQRLAMGISLADKRLAVFEGKYHVSSETFIETFASEDLEGGDDEYVEWAGEYKLRVRLQEHLRQLQEVEYAVA